MTGRIALVTGASSGIGAAVAHRLARLGFGLVLGGRRVSRLTDLAGELDTPVHVLPVDLCDRDAANAALVDLPESFAAVDLLVNSAGLASGTNPVAQGDFDDWDRMVDTNIKGMLTVTRTLLPGMITRNRGHIVLLGSVAGTYPSAGSVYGGTKAFVNHFALTLRRELLATDIRVTSIEPGRVDTEFNAVRFHGDEARVAAAEADGAFLSADDVAATVELCVTLPPHVNVNRLEVMAVNQTPGPFAYRKRPATA